MPGMAKLEGMTVSTTVATCGQRQIDPVQPREEQDGDDLGDRAADSEHRRGQRQEEAADDIGELQVAAKSVEAGRQGGERRSRGEGHRLARGRGARELPDRTRRRQDSATGYSSAMNTALMSESRPM